MLHELRVENLLLVERAELRLEPGLNVLTGETGAGKTMLAHALDLLLGGRARSGIVRAGAPEAYVEGVFSRPPELSQALCERVPDGVEELVVARRVWPDGRTRAYLCGRTATVSELRDLGGSLLSFYGQHEHRKLMLAAVQLDILDAHCGEPALELRARVGELHARVRELEAEREGLGELAGARERELDLLAYELEEIERAAPHEGELEELGAARDRLRNLEALQLAAAGGAEALSGEGGVGELLARALPGLEGAAAVDPALAPLVARLQALAYEAEDIGGELRRHSLESEEEPGCLEEVEERLALLSRLVRKHGGTLEEVLRHAASCRARAGELERAEVTLEAVERALAEAHAAREEAAGALSQLRRDGSVTLASAVRERLAELAMPDAVFEVQVTPRAAGCGPRGGDAVEFTIAANRGMPAGPLREVASGGELSRVMLALLGVAHAGTRDDEAPLLVFDEIDAGIGGLTARAVGEHLRELARGRQVLCITHLPQVAAQAARHFTIVKDGSALPARTSVAELSGEEVVGELVRMLGAAGDDAAAGEHARALLRAAA